MKIVIFNNNIMKIKLNQSIKYTDIGNVKLLSWHINQSSLNYFSDITEIITTNKLMQIIPKNNFTILSTCNRVEIYIYSVEIQINLINIITFINSFSKNIFKDCFKPQIKFGINAIKHLMYVTGGLKSIAFGEYQIQGQVKNAYIIAMKIQKICSQLISIFELALRAGKRIRKNTIIGQNNISLSSLAIDILLQRNYLKKGSTILIVGTGKMAVLAVNYFMKKGINSFIIFSKNHKKEMKGINGAKYLIVPLALINNYLKKYDFIFIAISPNAQRIPINLKNRKKYSIIDLSIPQYFINYSELLIINMELIKKVNPNSILSLKPCIEKCKGIIDNELTHFINKNNFRINLNNNINNVF
jgi:glutamyl-tRNA reductase